jgi:foldase protein PrsA
MSIMRMRKMFRNPIGGAKKHHWWASPMFLFFVLIIIIFVIGAYYSFGPGGRGAGPRQTEGAARNVPKVIAMVDRTGISRAQFDAGLSVMSSESTGEDMVTSGRYMKQRLLDDLIQNVLLKSAEAKEGIKVSGKEIADKRKELVEKSINNEFPQRKDLIAFLKKKQLTYEQFQQQVTDRGFRDDKPIQEQLMQEKLEKAVKDKVQPTEDQIKDSYTEVKAQHILITPDSLRKKAEEEAKKAGAQAPAQQDWDALAKKKADDLLVQIKGGADFSKLANENTDDPSGKGKGGDLGWFKKGMMVPEFDAAAFALQPGQVSEVIKTDFGYHIIKVEDRRQNLPADFEKDKQKYTAQVTDELKNRAWTEYQANLKKAAKIEILDPELKAYDLMKKPGHEAEAAPLLDEAVRQDPNNLSAEWELAQLYQKAGEKDKAMQLLAALTQNEKGASSAQAHMAYAKLLQDSAKDLQAAGKTQEAQQATTDALAQYKSAADWASSMDFQNYSIHTQLKSVFQELKQADLVKAEDQWMAEFMKQQQESGGMGGMGGMMPMQLPVTGGK